MNIQRIYLLIITVLTVSACSTTIESTRRVNELNSQPESIHFIWSSLKEPIFSNLPALGTALIGTSGHKYFENYASEHAAFGIALQPHLEASLVLQGKVSVERLPVNHTSQQHSAAFNQAKSSASIVLLYPEKVSSFCTLGCYGFKVRVSYLSPRTRTVIWTGLIDIPPKAKHSDPFDARALSFSELMLKQFATERLLPP